MMVINQDKEIDVTAVGSWTNFDHVYRVERIPKPGDTVLISDSIHNIDEIYWGGCAPNNIVASRKLGATCALISVVGQDFSSRGYEAYLRDLEIDLRGTIIVNGESSGHSFLFCDPNGDTVCISYLGVADKQDEFEPNHDVLSTSKIVIINYRFDRFTLKAAQIASNSSGRVIVSGALDTAPEYAEEFIKSAEILVCTEHELFNLINLIELEEPSKLFEVGINALVITKGKKGSVIRSKKLERKITSVSVTQVIDPVGAGDGFVGGLATGLAFGYSLEDAVKLGSSVASYVVEAIGCQTNLPSLNQALKRVYENYRISLEFPLPTNQEQ